MDVPWWHPNCHSVLANLPSLVANPYSPLSDIDLETRGFCVFCVFLCLFIVDRVTFCVLGVFSLVSFALSVPVQVIAWKDSSPKWPVMCWAGRKTTHSFTHSSNCHCQYLMNTVYGHTEEFISMSLLICCCCQSYDDDILHMLGSIRRNDTSPITMMTVSA